MGYYSAIMKDEIPFFQQMDVMENHYAYRNKRQGSYALQYVAINTEYITKMISTSSNTIVTVSPCSYACGAVIFLLLTDSIL